MDNALKIFGAGQLTEQLRLCNVSFYSVTDITEASIVIYDRASPPAGLLQARIDGRAVFAQDEILSEVDLQDLIDGFLNNQEGDWYAKLFADPVIVANPANLKMKLGSTINPRAIILNAGIDGKGGQVSLGRASHIGADCLLNLGAANFRVGNFSMISANFSAHTMRHTTKNISSFAIKKGPFAFFGDIYELAEDIEIGNDVWIGDRVTCLPGVKIATGSVIGAGAIVTRDTEPYGIYVGNPARLVRYRFDEPKRRFLLESKWWDYGYKKLKDIQGSFRQNVEAAPISRLKELLSC